MYIHSYKLYLHHRCCRRLNQIVSDSIYMRGKIIWFKKCFIFIVLSLAILDTQSFQLIMGEYFLFYVWKNFRFAKNLWNFISSLHIFIWQWFFWNYFSSVCVALEKNVLRFMLFMQSPTLLRASINFTDRKIYLNIFGTLFLAHMWYFKLCGRAVNYDLSD